MVAERRVDVVWEGDLISGHGVIQEGSGALVNLPVSWAARTGQPEGKTSPEELIAAALASCYAMACSHTLKQAGFTATRLDVTARCSFDPDQARITTCDLDVRGDVPGIDQGQFEQIARQAEQGCPVSNALRNNVQINLRAQFASAPDRQSPGAVGGSRSG